MQAIYEPRGAAAEYAPLACNLYAGCAHGCRYCYAPACLHRTRDEFARQPAPRAGILKALLHDAQNMRLDDARPILLSFTSDPYQQIEADCRITRQAIRLLGEWGKTVRVLTKNGALAARDFDIMRQYNVEFGATVCFDAESMRADWEPNAPSIASRMNALAEAHNRGIRTWVSMEPVIAAAPALCVFDLLKGHVDMWKVGKLNHMPEVEQTVDWRAFLRAALERLEALGASYYIKDALWAFADTEIKAKWPKERMR